MPEAFAEACIETIDRAAWAQGEAELRTRIDHVNRAATWSVRAGEWVEWLQTTRE